MCKKGRRIVHAHLLVVQRQAEQYTAQHLLPTGHCRRCSCLWRHSFQWDAEAEGLQKGHVISLVVRDTREEEVYVTHSKAKTDAVVLKVAMVYEDGSWLQQGSRKHPCPLFSCGILEEGTSTCQNGRYEHCKSQPLLSRYLTPVKYSSE